MLHTATRRARARGLQARAHLLEGPVPSRGALLLVFLAACAGRAETNGFQRQMITLPANATATLFADLENNGRSDLLAVDPVEKRLLIYRQRASGFTDAPDQIIKLPPQTAWIAPCDVDAHPGLELVMSTATGLVYYRQNGGVFESEPRTLIKAAQVFTSDDSPSLFSLATNTVIPVICATQAVLYRRNDAFEWKPGQPIALEAKRTTWDVKDNEWMMGSNPTRGMHIEQSFRSNPDEADDQKPENDTIRKLIEEMKKAGSRHRPGMSRVDVDGDGRKDLVLWQVLDDLETRTDVYVFLRGADGKLPERPTQVLHCRGGPIPVPDGSMQRWSPIADLKGDGTHELVLLELRISFASSSSLVETLLSHGLNWALTIRTFHHGAFSRSPDAAIAVTKDLTVGEWKSWPFLVRGDFNGDGRPDFLVRRSATQWSIYFSTNDGRWFAPQPAMTFETPIEGYLTIRDLNGDGRPDIVLRGWDDPRMFIYLWQSQRMKDNP